MHRLRDMDLRRTLIIGNCGTGKSWLAGRLAEQLNVPWTELWRKSWHANSVG